MSTGTALLAILLSAACTFFLRALPFLAFGGRRTLPRWLEQLGQTLPAAIMAVLIVYCLRDIGGDWLGVGLPRLIAVAIVAATYLWRHSTLLSIAAGTAGYMLLLPLFAQLT